MKRFFALLLVVSTFSVLSALCREYEPVQKGAKWGIRNAAGEWTAKPKYFEIRPFGRNFFVKTKKGRYSWSDEWALVDERANVLVSPIAGTNRGPEIIDDKFAIVRTGEFGIVDTEGSFVVPCIYGSVERVKDMFLVRNRNGYGLLDNTFKEILPCRYKDKISVNTNIPEVVYSDGRYISVITGETRAGDLGSVSRCKNDGYEVTYTTGGSYRRLIPGTRAQYITVTRPVTKHSFCYKDGHFYDNENQIPAVPAIDPSRLPVLHLVPNSLRFTDPSGNNAIDADEICRITFRVSNTGKGAGIGCIARIKTSAQGISIADKKLPTIPAGETVTVEIPVTASQTTVDGKADFRISVYEPNGFGCDPTMLTVATKAFVSPMLQITDYAVSGTENATIVKRQPFDLQLLLQNTAHGTAENVVVEIKVPDNVFITEGERQFKTASMQGGAKRSLNYSLIVNNNYSQSSVPVTVSVREKNGDRYTRSRTITLPLNQTIASSNRIVVDEVKSAPQGDISIARIEGKVQQAEVDTDIPVNRATNENTFAVIIANENYSKLSRVEFALNDGRIFGEYCRKTLGLPASNVRYYPDATYGDMIGAVKDIQRIAAAYDGNIRLIFYYAGHGAPEETSKNAYMLPTDAYGVSSDGCYALSRLYRELGDLRASSVTVFFDACFSGGTRDGKVVASARGVALKPKEETLTGNIVVFSAVSADQTALPFAEKGHGLFTYYLLKKLQESRGDVSLGELSGYIDTNVSRKSNVVNRKPQTPTVAVSPMLAEKWRNMRLK